MNNQTKASAESVNLKVNRDIARKCNIILTGYAVLFVALAGLGGYTVHMAVTQPDLNKIE